MKNGQRQNTRAHTHTRAHKHTSKQTNGPGRQDKHTEEHQKRIGWGIPTPKGKGCRQKKKTKKKNQKKEKKKKKRRGR